MFFGLISLFEKCCNFCTLHNEAVKTLRTVVIKCKVALCIRMKQKPMTAENVF